MTAWVDRTRDLDEDLDQSWALLRQARESSRLNPRRAAQDVRSTELWEEILRHDEQAIAECRSMARTIGHGIENVVSGSRRCVSRGWTSCRRPARRSACRTQRGWWLYDASSAGSPRTSQQNPLVLPRYAKREELLRRRPQLRVRANRVRARRAAPSTAPPHRPR